MALRYVWGACYSKPPRKVDPTTKSWSKHQSVMMFSVDETFRHLMAPCRCQFLWSCRTLMSVHTGSNSQKISSWVGGLWKSNPGLDKAYYNYLKPRTLHVSESVLLIMQSAILASPGTRFKVGARLRFMSKCWDLIWDVSRIMKCVLSIERSVLNYICTLQKYLELISQGARNTPESPMQHPYQTRATGPQTIHFSPNRFICTGSDGIGLRGGYGLLAAPAASAAKHFLL